MLVLGPAGADAGIECGADRRSQCIQGCQQVTGNQVDQSRHCCLNTRTGPKALAQAVHEVEKPLNWRFRVLPEGAGIGQCPRHRGGNAQGGIAFAQGAIDAAELACGAIEAFQMARVRTIVRGDQHREHRCPMRQHAHLAGQIDQQAKAGIDVGGIVGGRHPGLPGCPNLVRRWISKGKFSPEFAHMAEMLKT